jgi:hypothetical protein
MSTIIPTDIYLLETFSSADYLAQVRDIWGTMLNELEDCLERFMRNLPLDYRNHPLPEQPDAVWGEKVLPNFRSTYDALCSGVIMVSQGDPDGLYSANRVANDFIGQRDSSTAWLSDAERTRYEDLLNQAYKMATNVAATVGWYWERDSFKDFQKQFGPIDMPAVIPAYRLNRAVTVKSGDPVKRAGVYQPDKDNSIAAYLQGDEAPEATVTVGVEDIVDELGVKYDEQTVTEEQPCVWTLLERDAGATAKRVPPSLVQVDTRRIAGGDVCPAAGYYFTPARAGSRQHFEQGQVMPTLDSSYGATFWQWDADQH